MPNIPVLLTFDCGPSTTSGEGDRTRQILQSLRTNPTTNGIIAAFFVQTSATRGEVAIPLRMNSPTGLASIQEAKADGHIIGVLTGSRKDNAPHEERVLAPVEVPWLGQNGLESDLKRARSELQTKAGVSADFVRSPTGARSTAIDAAYAAVSLKHVGWHIDAEDYPKRRAGTRPPTLAIQQADIITKLQAEVRNYLAVGAEFLIIRFRDTSLVTATYLKDFLAVIKAAPLNPGTLGVDFVTTTGLAQDLLKQSHQQTDEIVLRTVLGVVVRENELVMIDKQAVMPEMMVSLESAPNVPVEWRLRIVYERIRSPKDDDLYPAAGPKVVNGTQVWDARAEMGTDLRGGEAQITARWVVGNKIVEVFRRFRIRAYNPDNADVEALIGGTPWFAKPLARHESRDKSASDNEGRYYNQFNSFKKNKPISGPDDPQGTPNTHEEPDITFSGFGIFQLTKIHVPSSNPRRATAQELWSWKQNVQTGIAELNRHLACANRWMNAPVGALADPTIGSPAYLNGGQRVQALNETGVAQPVPVEIVGKVRFQDGTNVFIEHAVAMKMFNGAASHYCSWNNATATWKFNRTNHLGIKYVERVCHEA